MIFDFVNLWESFPLRKVGCGIVVSRDLSSPPGCPVKYYLGMKIAIGIAWGVFKYAASSGRSWAASNGPAAHSFFSSNKSAPMEHDI